MRLLIVDDESFVREGLMKSLPWPQLGIDAVDQADDGLSALERASAFPPDVLITDVRMPRMDGIELAREMGVLFPTCQIVFLSAYSDKEYLRAAISLKAVEYVEKPVDLTEMRAAVARAVAQSREARQLSADRQASHEDRLLSLLQGQDQPVLAAQIAGGHTWRLALLKFRHDEVEPPPFAIATRYCAALVAQGWPNQRATLQPDMSAVLVDMGEADRLPALIVSMQRLLREEPSDVFACVGGPFRRGDQIAASLAQARGLLPQLFFTGFRHVVVPQATPFLPAEPVTGRCGQASGAENRSVPGDLPDTSDDEFTQSLAQASEDRALDYIHGFTSQMRDRRDLEINAIKDKYLWLLLRLQEAARTYDFDLVPDPVRSNVWESIVQVETLGEIEQYLLSVTHGFFERLRRANTSYLVIMVEADIAAHYQDPDLTLRKICDRLYISLSYMCVVYKRETAQTINQYLTSYRLDKAKQLIQGNRTRLQDVAHLVGYADASYFARLFKKVTGLTPSQFREAAR